MTLTDSVNRGYNLMICALLGLPGLALGTVLIAEPELNDKIDDTGLLVTGIIAVIWYLVGRNRFSRSVVPVVLVCVALTAQIVGVLIERDDKEAFGDNIGGSLLYVGLLLLSIVQYRKNAAHQTAVSETTAA